MGCWPCGRQPMRRHRRVLLADLTVRGSDCGPCAQSAAWRQAEKPVRQRRPAQPVRARHRSRRGSRSDDAAKTLAERKRHILIATDGCLPVAQVHTGRGQDRDSPTPLLRPPGFGVSSRPGSPIGYMPQTRRRGRRPILRVPSSGGPCSAALRAVAPRWAIQRSFPPLAVACGSDGHHEPRRVRDVAQRTDAAKPLSA